MNLRCSLGLLVLAAASSCAPGSPEDPEVPAGAPWSEASPWGSGAGSGAWEYRALAAPAGDDYALDLTFRIDAGTTANSPIHQLDRFADYNNQEDVGGYEAAAVLRRGTAGQYRLQLSSRWQEVLLWSSRGGILQVRPFAFAPGRDYRVHASAVGPHLRLSVDGQGVIDYWDTTAPIRGGAPALARKEGTTTLSAATVTPLAQGGVQAPAHRPRLSLRTWKDLRWGFDGDEPIFALGVPADTAAAYPGADALAYEVKVVPGYAAQVFLPLYFENVTGDLFALSRLRDVTVAEEGERLVFTLLTTDRGPRQELTGRTTVTLTYDPGDNVYRYDQRQEMTIPQGATVQVVGDTILTDPGMLGGVPPGSPGLSWPTVHDHSVYQHASGALFKLPHNHIGWYPGYGTTDFWQKGMTEVKPDGGFWVAVDDPVANPMIQMQEDATRKEFAIDMCGTGFDTHVRWQPAHGDNTVLAPGTYGVSWRLTSVSGERGQALLQQAGYAMPTDLQATWLLYTGGVGHVEAFDKVVPQASPFGEFAWGTGALRDATIGRTDSSSLRLSGPVFADTAAGDERYTESLLAGQDYEISVWAKTQDVVGEGPGVVFSNRAYYPGITGTTGWQQLRFVARADDPLTVVPFTLHNSGAGTVWFDDFQIRPLPAGADAGAPQGQRAEPGTTPGQLASPPPRTDVALLYDESSDAGDPAQTLLDRSGHGNHAKLVGARWVSELGGRVFEVGGTGEHILMPGHPLSDLGDQASLSLWVKPGAQKAGLVMVASGGERDISDTWELSLTAAGDGTYKVTAAVRAGVLTANVTIAPDSWSHLLLSYDGQAARLYVNGAPAASLPLAQIFWGKGSRGFVRFGAGVLEQNLISPFTGRLAGIRVFTHALSDDEVQQVQGAGPLAD